MVLAEDLMRIIIPTVSCDVMTLIMMNRVYYFGWFTCLRWCWFGMDIMMVLLNLIKQPQARIDMYWENNNFEELTRVIPVLYERELSLVWVGIFWNYFWNI